MRSIPLGRVFSMPLQGEGFFFFYKLFHGGGGHEGTAGMAVELSKALMLFTTHPQIVRSPSALSTLRAYPQYAERDTPPPPPFWSPVFAHLLSCNTHTHTHTHTHMHTHAHKHTHTHTHTYKRAHTHAHTHTHTHGHTHTYTQREMANAYTELNDPREQAKRFHEQR